MQITITNQPTTLLIQELRQHISHLGVGLTNQGAIALNTFSIDFQLTRDGTWYTWFDQSTDWTNLDPSSVGETYIRTANGDPTTLAAGSSMAFMMENIDGWYALRIRASVASGNTILDVEVGGE